MTTFIDAQSADGPALAGWVRSVTPYTAFNAYQRRLVARWAETPVHPSYYEADRILCSLGLHPSSAPEQVWREAAPTDLPDTCANCGGPLTRAQQNDGNRSCSKTCADTLKAGVPRAPAEAKACAHCGTMFEKPIGLSRANWGRRQFCTPECRWLGTDSASPWRRKRRAVAV